MIERQVITPSRDRFVSVGVLLIGVLMFGWTCFVLGMRVAGFRSVSYEAPIAHRDAKPDNMPDASANVIPKASGATLQDSLITDDGSTLRFHTALGTLRYGALRFTTTEAYYPNGIRW